MTCTDPEAQPQPDDLGLWPVDDEEDTQPIRISRIERARELHASRREIHRGMTPAQRRVGYVVAAIQVVLLVLAAAFVAWQLGPLPVWLGLALIPVIVVGGYRYWTRELLWV